MDTAGGDPEERCLQAPGASGRAKDPAWPWLSLEEQQHRATFPGSLVLHLMSRWKEGGYEREGRGRRESESTRSRRCTHAEQTEACIGWHCLTCSRYCCRLAAARGGLASIRCWPGAWWGKGTGKRLGPHEPSEQGKLPPGHPRALLSVFAFTWEGKGLRRWRVQLFLDGSFLPSSTKK